MLGEGGRGAQLPLAGLPLLSNRQRPAQSSLRLAFPAQRQEDLALQTIQFSFKKPLSGMRGNRNMLRAWWKRDLRGSVTYIQAPLHVHVGHHGRARIRRIPQITRLAGTPRKDKGPAPDRGGQICRAVPPGKYEALPQRARRPKAAHYLC